MAQIEPARPWQIIARELGKETDTKRILQLCDELTAALRAKGTDDEQPISTGVNKKRSK